MHSPTPSLVVRLFRFLGRVQFTMVLLLVGVVVMTMGTVIESRSGAQTAQAIVYRSTWFDVYLVLIVVNLVVSVINRIPIQRHQWAFVLTHFSIVALMVGAWISRTFGFEGQLAVREGDSENRIWLDDPELRVRWAGSEQSLALDRGASPAGRSFALAGPGNASLRIEQYEPNGEQQIALVEGAAGDGPGVELHLDGMGVHTHELLIADDRQLRRKDIGPVEVEFLAASSESFLASRLPAMTSAAATVELRPAGAAAVTVELPKDLDKVVDLGGGISGRVRQFLTRARVAAGGLVDSPQAPVNPAAQVEIWRGEQRENHTVFSEFPQFNLVKGRDAKAPLVEAVTLRASSVTAKPLVTVLVDPATERLWVQLSATVGRGEALPFKAGQDVGVGNLGLDLKVLRHLPRARADLRIVPAAGKDAGQPWLRLAAGAGGTVASGWLRFGTTGTFDCSGQPLTVAWDRKVFTLPFAVTLEDFEINYHPGSMRPSQYASHIKLRTQGGSEQHTTISMNRPLDYAGFRLFQSSYQRGEGRDTTILTVSHDPGVAVVYPSFILLILGVAWYLVGSGRRQRNAVATPAPVEAPPPPAVPQRLARSTPKPLVSRV